jgi:hypothetical protein
VHFGEGEYKIIAMLQIAGKDVTGATLGAAFDGDDFGAFEIDLPQQGDTQRILSVEWQKKTRTGTIRDKSRNENPGPYHTTFSSAITCKIQG